MRVLLAVCGLAAVAVPAAEAGGPAHVQGVVKIRNSAPAFHGRVVAENSSCNGPRPLKLYERKRNGDRKLLGKTTADLDGKWQVLVDPLKSGVYFATAPKADRNDGGVEFVCERAKSRELFVD
jgi:hypothetical protein